MLTLVFRVADLHVWRDGPWTGLISGSSQSSAHNFSPWQGRERAVWVGAGSSLLL